MNMDSINHKHNGDHEGNTQVDDKDTADSMNRQKQTRFALTDSFEKNKWPSDSLVNELSYDNSGLDDSVSVHQIDDEAIPNIEYYATSVKRVISRPTMRQLHDPARRNTVVEIPFPSSLAAKPHDEKTIEEPNPHIIQHKFGWIRGVLIRCILSILGTLLYLRMGYISGRAGLGLATLIVAWSATIVTITALSMSALCTNGEIKAGGAYFMLSRSLGPEFGGTMGVAFALADALASAMNVVGFAECIRDTVKDYGLQIVDGDINDSRIIAAITEVVIFTIVMISVSWEAKIELVLIVVVIVSFANYIIGTFIPPNLEKQAQGYTGWSWTNVKTNFFPDWRDESFQSIFGIYFPSITGILAGAGISGELKDPNTAIPKGTLLGILITTTIYLSAIWFTGVTAVRDATGSIAQLANHTAYSCWSYTANNASCKYGLQNDYRIMYIESGWWPLILAGIFGTSVSSALTLLVSSPRTIQALAKDKLYPHVAFLGTGSARDNEPRRAYILVFLIGLIMIAIGDLNAITPLVANFYLASFLLINYACFDGSLAKSPGWRPAFKYYNMWISLFGAALCLAAMFVMHWPMALVTIVVMAALYVFLLRRKPDVNWGSSSQAHVYREALQGMLNLMITPDHVKNWRPQILCLTGNPIARCCLADFAAAIARSRCLLICGNIILPGHDRLPEGSMKAHINHIYAWFKQRKIKSFYSPAPSPTFYDGVKMLIQTAGLGKLQPNILFVGFKTNWRHCPTEETLDYVKSIHEAFDNNLGLCILRIATGMDCTEMLKRYEVLEANRFHTAGYGPSSQHTDSVDRRKVYPVVPVTVSFSSLDALQAADHAHRNQKSAGAADNLARSPFRPRDDSDAKTSISDSTTSLPINDFMEPISVTQASGQLNLVSDHKLETDLTNDPKPLFMIEEIGQRMRSLRKRHHLTPAQREVVFAMNQFRERIKKSTIDVYWLFDDGGLTVLIPQLLTMEKSFLEKGRLRIFTLATSLGNVKKEEESLKEMLTMFRIRYVEVNVLTEWHMQPKQEVVTEFEKLIAPFRVRHTSDSSSRSSSPIENTITSEFCVTDEEINMLKDKTSRHLRTREIVMEHSKEAQMIVITAPVPKKGKISSCLYMAWLDMLTRDLTPYNAPVLLIRGNQQSVLTFYS